MEVVLANWRAEGRAREVEEMKGEIGREGVGEREEMKRLKDRKGEREEN